MPQPPGQTTEETFESFVAARGDALWRSAWLLTGDSGRAEDLVQTALAKAWPHWRRLSDPGRFEAYTRRVLFNTYVAWWRRRWNGERPTDVLPEPTANAPGDPDPDLRRDLMSALAELPRGQRAVVVLRYFEDRTEAETAELLGISIGTVKSQTSRAMAALRRSPALSQNDQTPKDLP
ncbi:SigE family RNA polymerase sigma factor [Nocardioides sp. GXZ039]|uniref:SigE family RNA polymerase sigma factor n=1 Tax=Nocardioides sp. GXZ039 TaxID=3136018 RepID=UPI0030F470BE